MVQKTSVYVKRYDGLFLIEDDELLETYNVEITYIGIKLK